MKKRDRPVTLDREYPFIYIKINSLKNPLTVRDRHIQDVIDNVFQGNEQEE